MKNKSIVACLGHILYETLSVICIIVYRTLLWVSRKILKRHFGIETPLYKSWHRNHVAVMQRKLDREHSNLFATV